MQTLSKLELLSGKKQVDFLFEKGKRFNLGSFVIVWIYKDNISPFPAQVLISVPKKKIRKATTRNRVKRLAKESYRKQKMEFYEKLRSKKKQIQFAMIFQKATTLTYTAIDQEINLVLNRLVNKL